MKTVNCLRSILEPFVSLSDWDQPGDKIVAVDETGDFIEIEYLDSGKFIIRQFLPEKVELLIFRNSKEWYPLSINWDGDVEIVGNVQPDGKTISCFDKECLENLLEFVNIWAREIKEVRWFIPEQEF